MVEEKKENNLNTALREQGKLLTAGIQLAAGVLIFFFIGYWIDGKYSTKPIFTILFSMIGGIGSVYKFIRTALSMSK